MKFTKRAIFGILASCIMGLSAGEADAQTFTNTEPGGAGVPGGTYQATCGAVIRLKSATTVAPAPVVQAAIGGNQLGTVDKPIPGVVEWAAASGTQAVQAYYYTQMILSGASTKTVPTGVFVTGGSCATFLPGYDQLNTYPYYVAGTSGAVTYGGTFNYAGTTDQNIFPTTDYVTIAVAGAGNATVLAGDVVTAQNITSAADAPILVEGTLNITTGDSDINGSLTLADAGIMTTGDGDVNIDGAVASTGAITTGAGTVGFNSTVALTGDGTITTGAGAVGFTDDVTLAGTAAINTGDGPVIFTAAGSLDLAGTSTITTGAGDVAANGPVTTDDGTTITVGGLGDMTFGGTLALDGSLVNGGGAVGATGDINFDGATTIGTTGTITLGENAQLYISSTIENDNAAGTNLNFDCASNVFYDGGVQIIMPTVASNPYGNLDLSGAGLKTGGTGLYGADINICKNFDLDGGNLTMLTNSGKLVMTDPDVNPTYASLFEVVGNMQRTQIDGDARTLVFNNSATSIALGADADNPTSMTLNVQPGTNPNKYAAETDVNRKITLTYESAVPANPFEFTAQAGYRYSETTGWDAGNTQAQLRYYEAQTAAGDPEKVGTGEVYGKTEVTLANADSQFGTLSLAGIGNTTAAVPNGIGLFASGNDLLMRAGATTFYTMRDGRWTNPNTWDEGTLPSAIDNAELRHSVYVGIDGGFIGTDPAGNQTPEDGTEPGGYYGAGVAAAKDVRIVNKAGAFAGNNPALIIGNEDNGASYIFTIAGNLTNENAAENLNTLAFPLATAKGDLNPGNIQGVWLINSYGAGVPGLGVKAVSNSGNFNNEGVIEVGE